MILGKTTARNSLPAATRSMKCSAALGIPWGSVEERGRNPPVAGAALASGMIALRKGQISADRYAFPRRLRGRRPSAVAGLCADVSSDWVW